MSACPVCGSGGVKMMLQGTDRLFGTTRKSFAVVECTGCRLMRLSPAPSPEELSNYYPANYWFAPVSAGDRLAELWRGLVLNDHVRFARRVLEQAPAQGTILDVGCGGGLFLKMLGVPRNRVLGLDNSPDAARVAWQRNGVPAVCASLLEAPLAARSCAMITMYHVLEHLYDPAAYVAKARELLAPNGRLIVQVPNAACWQFLLFGEYWNGLDIPRHLVDFRESDIRAMLQRAGFEVLRTKHFSLRDNPAGFASSVAAGLDPMGRRSRLPNENAAARLLKDGLYFGLVLVGLPFAWLEALCGAGSSVMIEARVT